MLDVASAADINIDLGNVEKVTIWPKGQNRNIPLGTDFAGSRTDWLSGLHHDRTQRHHDILPRSLYWQASASGIVTA
ncbi:hypothetical protein HB117_12580 [Escherichia coli]|nr:hypothetical protein HB117_12580 [Escherichia coli]UJY48381.1 hypothetical protein K3392_12415 [Escherichia coli]